MIIGRLKKRIKTIVIKKTAFIRRKQLNSKNFTIISNNCWGGDVYRYFSLPYQSPTVGLYFWADDYIRFLKNLPHYLSMPLTRIDFSESKYKEQLLAKNQQDKLLARLDDVELVLLHYNSWEEAKEKWERRLERVNYDNLIIKFSRQNLCTEDHLCDFLSLPYTRKIFFDNNFSDRPCVVYIPGFENELHVRDDISSYRKHMDILKFLNEGILQ